jgi:hypothetical protein
MGMARTFPTPDESFARLHDAGWSIGETGTAGHWLVSGTNGENEDIHVREELTRPPAGHSTPNSTWGTARWSPLIPFSVTFVSWSHTSCKPFNECRCFDPASEIAPGGRSPAATYRPSRSQFP